MFILIVPVFIILVVLCVQSLLYTTAAFLVAFRNCLLYELLIGILYAKILFQWQRKGILQNSETGSSYEESNDRSV